MSSLTQALSIALSGLQASTSLISLASQNISNANTPGYTEKTAVVSDVDYGNQFGGAAITSYTRASDQALTTDYNAATSTASYASTQNNYMTQVQAALDPSSATPTLSADMANFSAAWSYYSANPESSSAENSLISSGQALANDIRTAVGQAGALKTQIQSDITSSIATVNTTIKSIAATNEQIQQATASGQETVDLQDQLDGEVQSLSSYMNVTVQSRPNGQVAVYTPSGQVLVDQQSTSQFTYNGSTITNGTGADVTSALSGGSLQAATDFISTSTAALASTTPGVGTIGQFDAQITKLCDALTDSSGNTTSAFATAYTAAVTASTASGAAQAGQTLAASFFTVTNDVNGNPDPTTFNVTNTLTSGTAEIPQTGTQAIADSFNATATYTASGLSAPNVTYAGLTTAILSNFQQEANTISSQSSTASSQQTYYQQAISNKTGVNTDTELANLVTLQNSYAASAHVMTTINQMLTTLMSITTS